MARVVIERLTKDFSGPGGERIRALSEVSLTIEDGQFLVLLGPSGCGKTTLLRLIAGLEEPTAGTISIRERVVNQVPPKERDVAMVFQNPALYPHLTAYENMAFGLELRRAPTAEIERRVHEAAELLGLTDCLQRFPMALSGGQRQRVAFGRALVRRPAIFLLDEPLSNLDPQIQMQLRSELSRLRHRLASTFLYVTHDQAEAMALGDQVAVLRHGAIQQIAPPLELYRNPGNLFVAGFVGTPAANFIRGALSLDQHGMEFHAARSDAFRLQLREIRLSSLKNYVGKPVVLSVRPEHIAVQKYSAAGPPPGSVSAVVDSVAAMGAETILQCLSDAGPLVTRVSGNTHVSQGEKLWLTFDLPQAHFFDPASESRIE